MQTPSVVGICFSAYKTHTHEVFYGPAQGALVQFQFRRKFRNSSMTLFFNSNKRVTLRHSDTATGRVLFKTLRKFTFELVKTFSELLYTLGVYVFS